MVFRWHVNRGLAACAVAFFMLSLRVANVLPVADVQAAASNVELDAPSKIKLGEPIQIKLAVQNAADVAGYEANLEFDSSAVELNGVSQRHSGDLKAQGRDVQALGPVERPNEVSFGMYSCPVADCVDRASSRHDGGLGGRVQLAVIELAAHQPGVVEVRFSGAHFVDASGGTIGVRGGEPTLRGQVGDASSPVFSAPAVGRQSAVGHAPGA